MREAWIDVWKGWLILLVVVGHVVGGGSHFALDAGRTFLRCIYFLIYSFHMPAFFFVSGWLWHRKSFRPFIAGLTKRLLIPYFIVGVVSAAIYCHMYGGPVSAVTDGYYAAINETGSFVQNIMSILHAGGWPDGNGFRCNSVLWFLPCLFTVEVVYWILEARFPSLRSNVVVGVAFLLMGFSFMFCPRPNLPWAIGELPRFMPWFVAGRVARQALSSRSDMNCLELIGIAMLHAILVWLSVDVVVGAARYWFGAASIAAGIMLSLGLARILARNGVISRCMAVMGMASMSIMLWHKFVVVALQMKFPFFKNAYAAGVIPSLLSSALIIFVSIAVVLSGDRIYDNLLRRLRR